MNIVLLGAPGSGKGTQAEKLAKQFGLFYFKAGAFSRKLAEKDSRIKRIVNSGELIPEKEMTGYVLDYLNKEVPEAKNILFEGWPRFITQYIDLENWIKSKGKNIDVLISLDISEEKAVERISTRRICDKCGEIYNLITNPPPSTNKCKCGGELVQRKDDNPESIKVRFSYYYENTKKLIDYLDREGKLIRIDGEREIDVIYDDLLSRLKTKDVVK